MRYIIAAIILMLSTALHAGQLSNQYSSGTLKCLLHLNNTTGNVNEVSLSTVEFSGTASIVSGKFSNAMQTTKTGSNFVRVSKSSDCALSRSDENLLVQFWFMPSTVPAAANQDWAWGWRRNGGGVIGMSFGDGGTASRNDNWQYYQDTDVLVSGSGNDLTYGTINMSSNTWYYCQWAINRTSGKMQGFINGTTDYDEYTLISGVDTRAPMDIVFGFYAANVCIQGKLDEISVLKRRNVAWTKNECVEFYKKARGMRGIR
jgi:hypothetical protein